MKRTTRNAVLATALAAGGLVAAGAASSASAATLNMSGASFPQVAYRDFCATGGDCNYAGGGSGAGIRNLVNGVNSLIGSDAPLTSQQLGTLGPQGTPVYIPTLLGAIAVPVNIPGVRGNSLKLTGAQIGDIFSGQVTNWRQLRSGVNARVNLPNAPITACVRSDGSGTSFGFSNYLGKVSPSFGTRVGKGGSQTPPWTAPNVQRTAQNPGVANCVRTNQNSIGYVDLADTIRAGLGANAVAVGASRVIRGRRTVQYVLPTVRSISAAGNVSRLKADLTIDFSASPAAGAYPIVITTWLVSATSVRNTGQVADAKRVANFFLAAAQQNKLASFGFAPLPANVLAAARRNVNRIG
jgi:phosphate transport system substrate-binding protein